MKEKFIDLNAANLAAFSVLSYFFNLGYHGKLVVYPTSHLIEVVVFTDFHEIIEIPDFLYFSSLKGNDFVEGIRFSSLEFRFDYAD